MDRVKYQSILNKLDKQDTAVPSTYENIVNTPIGNSTNRRPTDLENFYTQNRIREADSVNSIYNDPEYASTIFNSSVSPNQLEENIRQSKGATLTPYNKSLADYMKQGASYVGKNVFGLNNYQSNKFGRQMFGDRGSDQFSKQIGFMDIVPAFKSMHMASIPMIPSYLNEAYRAFDRGDTVGGAIEGTAALAEGFILGKPISKSLKELTKSLSSKLKSDPSKKMRKLEKELGVLSTIDKPILKPNMIANTKLQAPNLTMKDPKVVDEFGFYSEAERQAKMMQQNKGSGAQFQGMLLNRGVKQDELDAIGLTDLFKNENVTKKEIIDTIELNKVALIETKKSKSLGDDIDMDDYFATETFTDIRNGEEAFKSADEVKEAYETGKYSRPTIEYDAKMYQFIGDDPYPIKLYGTINTHTPTGYKTVMFENLDDAAQDVTDIYFTFRPDADVKDWRNSVEAQRFIREKGMASTKDLILDDLAEMIQDHTAQSFDEAVVRLKSAAIEYGDFDPGDVAKWEGNTQKGGTNYKELLLRLPPKGYNRYGKNESSRADLLPPKEYKRPKDFQYRTHFDEFNPLFHIRTKDRVSSDGKKVLYVEELQSDWGQRGAGRGFKLEGEKLEAAKKELADVSKELTDLKKGGVELDGYEQEAFYKLAFPNRPPIRIPFKQPKDFARADQGSNRYLSTDGTLKDFEFDYSQSRMPDEFKTMTFGQYMNFYETMGRYRKGELNDASLQYRKESILNPEDSINKYYDDKDAEFLFGQLNQSGFASDGNAFLNNLSKKYLQKANAIHGSVPNAPFVTDRNKWTALAIKRLIKLADEGGYDAIAFSPGKVQYDRWAKKSLIDYYDKIIPQVASKLPKSLGVTTEKITIPIKPEVDVGVAVTYDNRYFVRNDGSDKAIEGKFFDNKEDAMDFMDLLESRRTNQETFAINITPKMRDIVRGGMPLFSTVGGMMGLGALGSMPSTQDSGT